MILESKLITKSSVFESHFHKNKSVNYRAFEQNVYKSGIQDLSEILIWKCIVRVAQRAVYLLEN